MQLPSVGASGGILIAWRHGLDRAQASRIDQYSVSTQFSTSDLQPWWLTCVYGPQGDDNKILFLQEIRNLRAGFQGPGLVVSDFNLITSVEDKNNGNINRAMVGRICSFGLSLGLREFPPFSPLRPPSFREFFVWSNFGLPGGDYNPLEVPPSFFLNIIMCSSPALSREKKIVWQRGQ